MKRGRQQPKEGEDKEGEEGLHMYDLKRGVRQTVLQKVHFACRRGYLLHGNIEGVRKPEGVEGREWRRYLGYYEVAPIAPYAIRKVSDEVGLGVFATAPIPKGTVMGLMGVRGRVQAGEESGTSMIKVPVTYTNPSKSKYVEDKEVEREVRYYLRGSMSFLNCACPKHANCDPHVKNSQPYERVKTKREISVGEELVISYGEGKEWSKLCNGCKDSNKKNKK